MGRGGCHMVIVMYLANHEWKNYLNISLALIPFMSTERSCFEHRLSGRSDLNLMEKVALLIISCLDTEHNGGCSGNRCLQSLERSIIPHMFVGTMRYTDPPTTLFARLCPIQFNGSTFCSQYLLTEIGALRITRNLVLVFTQVFIPERISVSSILAGEQADIITPHSAPPNRQLWNELQAHDTIQACWL